MQLVYFTSTDTWTFLLKEMAASTSASASTSEQLQLAILSQLDDAASSAIPDTREMVLPSTGQPAGGEHSIQMAIKAALDSLAGREMVESAQKQVDSLALTPEGEEMAQDGSYEYRVWSALGDEEAMDMKALSVKLGDNVAKVGQLNAFKEKWIRKEGSGFVRSVSTVVLLYICYYCAKVSHIGYRSNRQCPIATTRSETIGDAFRQEGAR